MSTYRMFVNCPNGDNFPVAIVEGEYIRRVNQEFVCPTCQCRFEILMSFPAVVSPITHNPPLR